MAQAYDIGIDDLENAGAFQRPRRVSAAASPR